MPLHRPCEGCGQRYLPSGKQSNYCDECLKKVRLRNIERLLEFNRRKNNEN